MKTSSKTALFTSTLDKGLLTFLNTQAKKRKQTRRALLENIISEYKGRYIKNAFSRLSNDADILDNAEWGMNDFSAIIKNNE